MNKNYYLGLDIGTNSVGWAVTDENYNLCRFRGKDMWGIRLFESAEPASDRRLKRSGRRRLRRRNQRIKLLQEIFAKEISNIDETFFIRLNESKLHMDDKSVKEKHPLFIDEAYNDVHYYGEYPTIYHLRKELIVNEEPHDARLVYLAIHHILKTRGHFLIEGNLGEAKDFNIAFDKLCYALKEDLGWENNAENAKEQIKNILTDKNKVKSDKVKEIKECLNTNDSILSKTEIKRQNIITDIIFKLIVGNKGDIEKLFALEKKSLTKGSFSFAESNYEEDVRPDMEAEIPNFIHIIDLIKGVYDWRVLVEILQGEDYISNAKVSQYEKHKNNLKNIKKLIHENFGREVYKNLFVDNNNKSYSGYIGAANKNCKKITVKKNSKDDFFKELRKKLEEIEEDGYGYGYVMAQELLEAEKIEDILPLQRNKSNGVIPNQIHKAELVKILENAAKYMSFLNEKDSDGISNKEKIISIFEFRIPYFIGPLSDRHRKQGSHNWMVRKDGENGRIYPWNIKKIVDYNKSNEAFIQRMTNKCTYLVGEDVLPKNSLLYSKYMVLNELNNLKIRGNKVSVKIKQNLYNDLFKNRAKVTGKMVLEYLKKDLPDLQKEDLSGFDSDFHTSLKSYMDFKKQIFPEGLDKSETQNMVEDIIRWITIYGDDSKMIKRVIEKEYPDKLTEEQLKKVCRFRYSGWGNFSKKFLKGIEGTDVETGETFNLISAMWQTNENLMQLLSGRFTFTEEIERENNKVAEKIEKISYEELVDTMYVSPITKRAIWQSIQISEEIKKVMGCPPEKIFVEMARGGGEKGNRTVSRKKTLEELYKSCKADVRYLAEKLNEFEDRDLNSMKLYLYFTQLGKCMYTGEVIDLDELMKKNSRWDRDHIYPQSKIKDDSIDNLVLVNKTVNSHKSNDILDGEIQKKMVGYWKSLLEKGFISKKKYDRLTKKGEFSEEELAGFISRQIVETGQSSKAVAELLKRINEDTEIVYVKAALASNFRKKPLNMLKSRRLNDYHHGKDAYLNIVVGNVYNAKFTSNPIHWFKRNKNTNYSLNKIFNFDIKRGDKVIWEKCTEDEDGIGYGGTIDRVRKIMGQDNLLYTEYTFCGKGEIFNANPISKDNKNINISLKSGLDPKKYGGYNGAGTSYFAQIEFDGKKGERVKNIIGVPIYIANQLSHNRKAFEDYCKEVKGFKNVKILVPKIKKNTLMLIDGFPMRIRGENEKNLEFRGGIQLILDTTNMETLRVIEKYLEKSKGDKEHRINEKLDKISHESINKLYDALLEKLSGIYAKRPANPISTLRENREKIIDLKEGLYDKVILVNEVVNLLRCDSENKANLSFVGGSKLAGSMTVNKNTVGKSKLEIIHQSVTGLFENRKEI